MIKIAVYKGDPEMPAPPPPLHITITLERLGVVKRVLAQYVGDILFDIVENFAPTTK